MVCIKCGHSNTPDKKYCEKCNAILLKMVGETADSSMIEVEEGFAYLVPEQVYVTPRLHLIMQAGYNYLTAQGSREEVMAVMAEVKESFSEFDQGLLPEMIETLQSYRDEELGKEYSRQMIYLLNKGAQLYREGLALAEEFVEKDDKDKLIEGLFKLQEGNDNLGLAGELMRTNLLILEEEMTRRRVSSRAEEFKARIAEKQEARERAREEVQEESPEEIEQGPIG